MQQIHCAAEDCTEVNQSVHVDAIRVMYVEVGWVEDEANDFLCMNHAGIAGGAGIPLNALNLRRL